MGDECMGEGERSEGGYRECLFYLMRDFGGGVEIR
jgi:hypothetical protein